MGRSNDALRSYWDRHASSYDAKTAAFERRFLADARRRVAARAHGATLEVAVGTGATIPYYAADVELTAVDWSEAMLQQARERVDRLDLPVELRRADATALPFPSASFDSVVLTYALCCIPDDRTALREAIRVLRPGGALLLADHVASTSLPLRALQRAAELVSVPLQGEHFTRRPATLLPSLGMAVVDGERRSLGVFEWVHARRTATEGRAS